MGKIGKMCLEVNIKCAAYKVVYFTYSIAYSMYKMTYLFRVGYWIGLQGNYIALSIGFFMLVAYGLLPIA